MEAGAPRPDLLVVSGGLTEAGGLREFDEALDFLTGTCEALGLGPERCVIVPGSHDVTRRACQAYFADCEADDIDPDPPYWPKWRHFSRIFDEFYAGVEGAVFDRAQPWTLFEIPGLRLVVAGLNSTMAESHRPQDHYGELGEAQVGWFAERLRPYAENGWLRLAVLSHAPAALRDAPALDGPLGDHLNLVLHGPSGFSRTDIPDSPVPPGSPAAPKAPAIPAAPPGHPEILHLAPDALSRYAS
jgi:3',5'-cyclic AMP phosphodiesterase CpdA